VALGYLQRRLSNQAIADLSTRLFRVYMQAPYAFHLRRNSAELTQNILGAAAQIFWVLNGAVNVLTQALTVLGLLTVVAWVSPLPTLLTAGAVWAVIVIFLRATRERSERWGEMRYELQTAILKHVRHGLDGIKELKALGREALFQESFARDQARAMQVDTVQQTIASVPRLLTEALFGAGVLFAVAAARIDGTPLVGLLPLLGLYAYAGIRAIPAANGITAEIGSIRVYLGATRPAIADLRELEREVVRAPPAPLLPFETLELHDVSFRYEGAPADAVSGIDLSLRRGESIGIAGATGAGKTTLADLILGLHAPSRGEVLLDGRPLAESLPAWQKQIGYVSQDLYLIDDSLRKNVALGIAEDQIDEERLRRALRAAQLEDFVAGLPLGADTVVGERGVRVSGGERQRVAIARALYHAPALVVLDEATAALDPATESHLVRALEALGERRTLIVIAHRLSALEGCDRVIVLAGGRVVDEGRYADLMKRSVPFRRLAAAPVDAEAS
jgi:ATP-binding cassette subfamily C protein